MPLAVDVDIDRSCSQGTVSLLRAVESEEKRYMQAVLTTASALALTTAQNVISLVGNNWTLTNDALSINVPASLPSQAHLDLYAAQVIGDPLYNLNDFNLRWVAYNNWTYTSHPVQGLKKNISSTWLRFDGLDTFTSISLCGQFVASTDNQYRQYWFDVTKQLQTCQPDDVTISINFGSAPLIANATAEAPGQETWPDHIQTANEFANVQFIRKEQSDFGWDWGPAFAPAGPWLPAYIVQLPNNTVHIRNSNIDIYREDQLPLIPPNQSNDWIVNASLDYFGTLPSNANLVYTLRDHKHKTIVSGQLSKINRTSTSITGLTTIPKDDVELWWPNGLGNQTLYHLKVCLNSIHEVPICVDKRVGFRTIVLNLAPISEEQLSQGIAPGNNWNFQINGKEFYAKGANFIPPDPFWPSVTVDRMTQLFNSVVEGNQNMLRVWSSGVYLPDFLYDLADERGILLWSEFEFSDHLYPIDEYFLDNVFQEAEYNVRRVNHHPSLALWAGGNELESLMLEVLVKDYAPQDYDKYVGEYEKLFIGVLTPAVFRNSRSISYTPTSTGNGWLTLNYSSDPLHPFTERYLNLTNGSIYGDTDYYNYSPDILGDLSTYPVGRFSNEFGFISFPSLQSWRQQVSEDQLYLGSRVTTLRCHHNVPGGLNDSNFDAANTGIMQMMAAVEYWYPIPHKTDRLANFTAWIYATQVYQADLYTSEISFYRRGSGMPERQLGSLYWQLEDQWVAPTWAGIEYDGRWKLLHYAAKDIFEPVIIAPYFNASTSELTAYVTSSLWEEATGNATFHWLDWSGNKLAVNMTTVTSFSVGAINTTKVFDINLNQTLQGLDLTNAVLHLEVTAQGRLPNTDVVKTFRHENWYHAAPLNKAKLVDPGLQLSYDNSTKNFTVSASSGIAAWVFLDYPSGALISFDTNGFWLAANESREVSYNVKSDDTCGRWVEGVTAQSIWNLTLSE